MPGKVNSTQAEALAMVCCQVMGRSPWNHCGGHVHTNIKAARDDRDCPPHGRVASGGA
jgi:hypothetical protein